MPFIEKIKHKYIRIFKHAKWIKHTYLLHVLNHEHRNIIHSKGNQTLANPYLSVP
jgi:hypothetical protein